MTALTFGKSVPMKPLQSSTELSTVAELQVAVNPPGVGSSVPEKPVDDEMQFGIEGSCKVVVPTAPLTGDVSRSCIPAAENLDDNFVIVSNSREVAISADLQLEEDGLPLGTVDGTSPDGSNAVGWDEERTSLGNGTT
jgi:hypothetical protein